MSFILEGLRITECAAFIACPYATMSLARMGAEVIRIDAIEGGLDYRRWPVNAQGRSLYWAQLNKGKKSVRIDIRSPEGQELAQAIITAPGEGGGMFATNLPATGWLDFGALRALRDDLIMIAILGNRDGSTALDYTVNCAAGFPALTGPADSDVPVNHVLPAWDLLAGMSAATALLAAERHRRLHAAGQIVRIALSDIAFAAVSDLGYLAEAELNGVARERHGNHIYGTFGPRLRDRDGRRVMVAAVSIGQWRALCKATGIEGAARHYETAHDADLRRDTDRFEAREQIAAWLEPWFASRTLEAIRTALDAERACWGPYQTIEQLLGEDMRVSTINPMFGAAEHRAIGRTLTARAARLRRGRGGPAIVRPGARPAYRRSAWRSARHERGRDRRAARQGRNCRAG